MKVDGAGWHFCAAGKNAAFLASLLNHAFGVGREAPDAIAVSWAENARIVRVSTSKRWIRWRDLPVERAGEISCRVGPFHTPQKLALQLMRLAQIVAHASERRGGLLVHGALAERNGIGVILAGPGGVGKTTASNRLPRSWRSLSDDAALIVRAADGEYWAHPWPTWSRYRSGDLRGSWDVQAAVQLRAICMLSQNGKDRAIPLPIRQAISELVGVSAQIFSVMANDMERAALRCINLLRFHNSVAISKKVPVCRLEISRSGKFWKEIEGFLLSHSKHPMT